MFDRILVLSPHTDDAELGCGASIVKFVEKKKEVVFAAFSICEKSVPKGLPKDILEKEAKMATAVLGIEPKNFLIYKFEVRQFPSLRQEILEELVKLKDKFKPELIFLPSSFDIHQDHKVITQEGIRAFKNSTILGYEMPWNNLNFNSTCFSALETHHINKKLDALRCYNSQHGKRNYVDEDFIKGLAKVRGVQAGLKYAEAFETLRWIMKI